MNEIAIVYHSSHHGNTKKVLNFIAQGQQIDLIPAESAGSMDLSPYRMIGFASGVYLSKMHPALFDFAQNHKAQLKNKPCFLLFTSGSGKAKYAHSLRNQLKQCGAEVIGTYHCLGYDTYGPFRLIGGIRKGHPNENELKAARLFFEQMKTAVG